jgi:hypothetical protein
MLCTSEYWLARILLMALFVLGAALPPGAMGGPSSLCNVRNLHTKCKKGSYAIAG